jgi:hypothetical protein
VALPHEDRTPAEPVPGPAVTATVELPALPEIRPGGNVHRSYSETVERHYDRARAAGLDRDTSKRIAREAARDNHRGWDREGRER